MMEVPGYIDQKLCKTCGISKRSNADGICEQCSEHMCTYCFDKHKQFKFNRGHQWRNTYEIEYYGKQLKAFDVVSDDHPENILPGSECYSAGYHSDKKLCRLMENKLGDNNPNTADLSDKNTPEKIAKKCQELYDSAWKDAFDILKRYYITEKATIEKLLQILLDIKAKCDEIARDQEVKLREAMTLKEIKAGCDEIARDKETKLKKAITPKLSGDGLPDHVFKQLKDLRRLTAEVSLNEVIEICSIKLRYRDYFRHLIKKDVSIFFKGCVELCWFMNVQDPPLVFKDSPMKNDQFDSNTFKFFTATGSKYEYMVMPALLFKKDGELLCKGVAQASKEQNSDSQRHRNDETGRNKQSHQSVGRHMVTDTTKTHLNSWDNRLERQNVNNIDNEQSVVTVDNLSDKTGFKQTEKERGVSFGSSHREGESDSSKEQALKPMTPQKWTMFVSLVNQFGIDSEKTITAMGTNYNVCKNYYVHHYGNDETESIV